MEAENIFASSNCNQTIRQMNAELVKRDSECQQFIAGLRKIEKFLRDFGFLTFGRDFVFSTSVCFSLNSVATSLELTMGNIIVCCESACIADANTLLRKYRDDLFFYLYISVYNSLDKCSKQAKAMANQIIKWANNNLTNFTISEVLKEIAADPQLKDAILKYNLKGSFQKISAALNNYVHGNGYTYYNRNINAYRERELAVELNNLDHKARYMTIVFLLLLIFCSPLSVMAEDYIDYLDFDDIPPEDSQYWVAPFVERFVQENISLVDENCLDYLRENTMMQF